MKLEWMEGEGRTSSEGLAVFLSMLRQEQPGTLKMIRDNLPERPGQALTRYLSTLGPGVGLVNLSGYCRDFNADETTWGWVRDHGPRKQGETAGNPCLGSKPAGPTGVSHLLVGLANRNAEVKRHRRTLLHSRVESLLRSSQPPADAHPTSAIV